MNTSDEAQKSGCSPAEVVEVCRHIKEKCGNLKLDGLMTIGEYGAPCGKFFKLLRELRSKVVAELGMEENDLELSMGMSGDFEEAVRHKFRPMQYKALITLSRSS